MGDTTDTSPTTTPTVDPWRLLYCAMRSGFRLVADTAEDDFYGRRRVWENLGVEGVPHAIVTVETFDPKLRPVR